MNDTDRRTWWGRFWRYWLAPFDCRGPDGRPSHSKVLATVAFFAIGLPGSAAMIASLVVHWTVTPPWMVGFVLAFVFLVFSVPYGLDGLKTFSKSKWAKAVGQSFSALQLEQPGKGTEDTPTGG